MTKELSQTLLDKIANYDSSHEEFEAIRDLLVSEIGDDWHGQIQELVEFNRPDNSEILENAAEIVNYDGALSAWEEGHDLLENNDNVTAAYLTERLPAIEYWLTFFEGSGEEVVNNLKDLLAAKEKEEQAKSQDNLNIEDDVANPTAVEALKNEIVPEVKDEIAHDISEVNDKHEVEDNLIQESVVENAQDVSDIIDSNAPAPVSAIRSDDLEAVDVNKNSISNAFIGEEKINNNDVSIADKSDDLGDIIPENNEDIPNIASSDIENKSSEEEQAIASPSMDELASMPFEMSEVEIKVDDEKIMPQEAEVPAGGDSIVESISVSEPEPDVAISHVELDESEKDTSFDIKKEADVVAETSDSADEISIPKPEIEEVSNVVDDEIEIPVKHVEEELEIEKPVVFDMDAPSIVNETPVEIERPIPSSGNFGRKPTGLEAIELEQPLESSNKTHWEWFVNRFLRLNDFYDQTISRTSARCVSLGGIAITEYPYFEFILDVLSEVIDMGKQIIAKPAVHSIIKDRIPNGIKGLESIIAAYEHDFNTNAPPEMIDKSSNMEMVKARLGVLAENLVEEDIGPAPDGFVVENEPSVPFS